MGFFDGLVFQFVRFKCAVVVDIFCEDFLGVVEFVLVFLDNLEYVEVVVWLGLVDVEWYGVVC